MTAPLLAWMATLAAAAALSYAGGSLLIRLAHQRGILDHPNERSSHSIPTPRGGGAPIVILVTLGSIAAWSMYANAISPRRGALLVAAALVLATISALDDVRHVASGLRALVHLGAAAAVLLALGPLTFRLPGIGVLIPLAAALVTAVWIVGLTNAYNFMDGIDGIAAAQAVIGGAGWAAVALSVNDAFTAAIALLVAATALGFLLHNWSPPSIFMGDVGSAFLGFTFATLPLIWHGDRARAPVIAFLLVWPFVLDSAFTFLRRLRKRERVFEAHRSHVYQRLCATGWSHARVTTLYATLAAVGAALAIAYARGVMHQSTAAAIVLALAAGVWGVAVRREGRR
jgi:UDP-N-acetylmuramyl pentapeptide phosphotransferase/UDP-N-acetylglucosamine-1-phosphate transferase